MSRLRNAVLGLVFTLLGVVLAGLGGYAAYTFLTNTADERAADCLNDSAFLCEDNEYYVAMGCGALGLIFLFFGLRSIVRLLREGRQMKRIQKVGVEVEGVLVELKGRGRLNRQPVFQHVIQFEGPNGTETFEHFDTRLGYEGDKLMVKYNPDKPSDARISQVWLRSGHARDAHQAKYGFLGQSEILGMKFENADLVPMKQPQAVQDRMARVEELQQAMHRGEITMDQYVAEVTRIQDEAQTASPNPLNPAPPGA